MPYRRLPNGMLMPNHGSPMKAQRPQSLMSGRNRPKSKAILLAI